MLPQTGKLIYTPLQRSIENGSSNFLQVSFTLENLPVLPCGIRHLYALCILSLRGGCGWGCVCTHMHAHYYTHTYVYRPG